MAEPEPGPGGSWRVLEGGVMGSLSPPPPAQVSLWAAWVSPGQGAWWQGPREPGEAAVTFETWSWKSRRLALLLGRRDHHPGGRRRDAEEDDREEFTAQSRAAG